MRNKLLSILLIGVLVLGLTGCGNNTKSENNSTNEKSDNNVITCIQLQQNPNFNEVSRETKTFFKNNKISNITYSLKTTDNKSAEEYCNTEGKRLTEVFENVTYEVKDNNCNIIYNIDKMSDSELEKTTIGRTRDTKTLITEMNYNDYYDYLSSNEFTFCNKGNEVEKKYPTEINGDYNGLIYASNGGTYDWHKVTMKFENNNKYTCSYSINNNSYEVVGNYTYDIETGKLELTMDKESSKGNTTLASSCYGTKRVYENIEEYDLEIVDLISDLEDYQKTIKLNNN